MDNNAKDETTKQEMCFVIMPISNQGDYPSGHFTKVYEQIIQPAVREAGYEPYRVDENTICDAIISKIFKAIQECPMAICDLSSRNPNVLYELGLRQAYDKPVVLIQDEKTEKIFDISGISTVFYKSTRIYEDVIDARENIKKAMVSTRDNKVNSLVRIIQASTPDLSKIEVSKDDIVNAKLDKVLNEINLLNQRDAVTGRNYDHNNMNTSDEAMNRYWDALSNIARALDTAKSNEDLRECLKMVFKLYADIQRNYEISREDKVAIHTCAKDLEKEISLRMHKKNDWHDFQGNCNIL